MSDNLAINFGCELQELNFKSCFARSEVAQFNQIKSVDQNPAMKNSKSEETESDFLWKTSVANKFPAAEAAEAIRFRKNSRNNADEPRRYSCSNINNIRRSCCCSNRLAEIPVENRANQSKIETLLWQLKETQKSREMYRAVMKQVVTYLEKAHQSLEILGSKMNKKHLNRSVKVEHHSTLDNSTGFCDTSTPTKTHNETSEDFAPFKEFSWKHTKPETSPDEIPPDKLASEAFRLLRTAQSLLNTCEPDLAQLPQTKELRIESDSQPMTDVDFLAQIAKEFPSKEYSSNHNIQTLEYRPQRATSFSLSPKVNSIETGVKMAFNRKLSLQLSEIRGSSKAYRIVDSGQESVAECDVEILNNINGNSKQKTKTEKSLSSGNGSVSSVEDESGFSSMNSFQDVGLPLVNSTITEEVVARNALLQSMLHDSTNHKLNVSHNHNVSDSTLISTSTCQKNETDSSPILTDDVKVWQKPSLVPQHRRWYSTPVEDRIDKNQSLKVLWV